MRELATAARDFLVPGGFLVLQLASFQWSGFADELLALGYGTPTLVPPAGEGPVAGAARFGSCPADRRLANPWSAVPLLRLPIHHDLPQALFLQNDRSRTTTRCPMVLTSLEDWAAAHVWRPAAAPTQQLTA